MHTPEEPAAAPPGPPRTPPKSLAWLTRSPRLAALMFFLALAAIHTWPLALDPGRHSRVDNGDYALNAWAVDWVARTLPTAPTRVFDANIFHPERHTLAYSEPLLLPGLLAIPAVWSGASAVFSHNFALLLGMALSGWAFAWYLQSVTGSWPAGLVAGSLAVFNAHNLLRLGHLQAQHLEFVPLAFVGLHGIFVRARPRDAVITGAALAAQALTSVYLLLFTGWALTCAGIVRLVDAPRRGRSLGLLAVAVAVAAVLLAPLLWPYAQLALEQGLVRSAREAVRYSASWRDYLYTGGRLHYELWSHVFRGASDAAFPGLLAAGLAVYGIVAHRADRPIVRMWIAVVCGAILLSVLPRLPGFEALHAVLPPLQSIRAYSRASQMALVGIAVLAGFGMARLLRTRLGARYPVWLTAAVLVVVGGEALRAPMHWVPFRGIPPIYDTLRAVPGAVVVELPIFRRNAFFGNARYMLNATRHHHPIVNGYSGFAPSSYGHTVRQLSGFPDVTALTFLHEIGVTHVVIHRNWLNAKAEARIDSSQGLVHVESQGTISIFRLRSAGTTVVR